MKTHRTFRTFHSASQSTSPNSAAASQRAWDDDCEEERLLPFAQNECISADLRGRYMTGSACVSCGSLSGTFYGSFMRTLRSRVLTRNAFCGRHCLATAAFSYRHKANTHMHAHTRNRRMYWRRLESSRLEIKIRLTHPRTNALYYSNHCVQHTGWLDNRVHFIEMSLTFAVINYSCKSSALTNLCITSINPLTPKLEAKWPNWGIVSSVWTTNGALLIITLDLLLRLNEWQY